MHLTELTEKLREAADPAIKAFGDSLQPGITNRIGVRMPAVRRLARDVMKGDVRAFLKEALVPGALTTQETVMVTGIVIGLAKGLTSEERLGFVRRYLPNLDGWATCDLFGTSLKLLREDRGAYLGFVAECLRSDHIWTVRTAEVWLLEQYRDPEWIEAALRTLEEPRVFDLAAREYYLSMSLAWCLSILYTVKPQLTADWTETQVRAGRLDRRTAARTVRKICESLRPTAEQKAGVKACFTALLAAPGVKEGISNGKPS